MGVSNVNFVLNGFFGRQLCLFIFCTTFWGKWFQEIHKILLLM